MTTTKSFSLYLAKPSVKEPTALLTARAQDLLAQRIALRSDSTTFGDGATVFMFPSEAEPPNWVKMLSTEFQLSGNLDAQSPSAVLVFRKDGNFFAVPFAFGHVYLDERKTEADFGLRVSINALNDDRLKSVERANIGVAIRDFAQAAGQRNLKAFGFDDALELIRKVSGYTSKDDLAEVVTGSHALRFTKKMEFKELPTLAQSSIKYFLSKSYKKTAFQIIDFLAPVLDKSLQDKLDEQLLQAIKDGSDEFEISLPEILSEDPASFRFELADIPEFHADLSLEVYRTGLGKKLGALSVADLKHHRVAAYRSRDEKPHIYWNVHHALVGSLVLQGDRYALNEGYWYRIGDAYKKSADAAFHAVVKGPDKLFHPLKKIAAAKKKGSRGKVGYQSEGSYNKEVAAASGYLLLDAQLIKIEEVAGQGVEACDLLDIPGRRFIHVKKSSRQSSVLSHFFKQGANSARLFKQYEPFKTALVSKVRELHGDHWAKELTASLKAKWTVEFVIADHPRKSGKFDIPFFSKLSLRDEVRTLQAMEFTVAIRFIKLA
jgi:uncharacterized protein (TIGR04141 family)